MAINQVEKKEYRPKRISYTSKDYVAILDDLINSISSITQKWNTTDENDPGMILIKLMAMLGDMLFFTQDMQSLEVYPNSVTQRKNAASIYKLIGYKMRWYKSAILEANVVNTYSNGATMPRFTTFTTDNDEITYTTFKQYELPSNMHNNGEERLIELVQGSPVTPVRSSNNPYPDPGKPWHSIYGYNYSIDDMIGNRIYLKDINVDQDHIILIDDQGEEWELKDNIYLTTAIGRFFQFDVDVNDNPYIEIVDYWKNFNITKFKIFYIRSDGEDGQIYANNLKNLTSNIWSRTGSSTIQNIYNVSNFIHFTNEDSSYGYNPETPDEARKNSVKYQNTMDTLITLADFERAVLRNPKVANVRATDLTNDPGHLVQLYVGDINKDGVIDDLDIDLLENFLADGISNPLTVYQKRLADINQDGIVNAEDLKCLRNYLKGDIHNSGQAGIQSLTNIDLLDGFVVKLYILPIEEFGDMTEEEKEVYTAEISADLDDYKILPLTIEIDLDSINKYYWTIEGNFFTKEPLSRDELQTIIVNINNKLRNKYSLDKINFNTLINYKEIIETILSVDNRILMVDLNPIEYKDSENNKIDKEMLTGKYNQKVLMLNNPNPADNLHYNIKLDHTPILPGSVMIRAVSNGEYTLKDNNNGQIFNIDNVLSKKGKIDYVTGEIDIQFTSPLLDDLTIDYMHNSTNIAVYKNLNTQSFYFDPSALQKDDMQDLI